MSLNVNEMIGETTRIATLLAFRHQISGRIHQ